MKYLYNISDGSRHVLTYLIFDQKLKENHKIYLHASLSELKNRNPDGNLKNIAENALVLFKRTYGFSGEVQTFAVDGQFDI